MSNLLLDITEYLVGKGIVQADGVDIFRDFSPNEPDDVVVLYEYLAPPTVTGSSALQRQVQFVARSKNPDSARTRAHQMFGAVDIPMDRIIELTATRWAIITANSPIKIGVDESNRVLWAFNATLVTTRD